MCANLFEYVGAHDGTLAQDLLLNILDGIGFDRTDLDRMTARNILSWD